MTTKKEVAENARLVGLEVMTYAPRDGMTRYRFFPKDLNADGYFASSGELFTALGANDAMTFLAGYQAGLRS
jgi:hypothetical protein